MDTDVVHEYDVASLQGGSEKLFGIGVEHLAGHRPFEHEGRGNTIMTQRSDESDGFPIAVWHLLDKPFALRCPPVEAGNRRGDAGFVDKDKALRIKSLVVFLQELTFGGCVRPILLASPPAVFL